MKEAAAILDHAGINPTPNRLLVVDALLRAAAPLSLADLEQLLPTMERSGIFRVLNLLATSHITHSLNDGTRSVKYELCPSHGHDHSPSDGHVHFHCRRCGRTFCTDVPLPPVTLPAGFDPESANYIIEGLCPRCAR